jgi:hypothetical protein
MTSTIRGTRRPDPLGPQAEEERPDRSHQQGGVVRKAMSVSETPKSLPMSA